MKKRSGKPRLTEIIAYEKTQMLPWTFTFSYVLTPIYAVVCIFLFCVFGILMEIDEKKYLVPGLLCLGAFILISAIFLASVPFIRQKTINAELKRYNFDTSDIESLEIYDFSTKDFSLKFDKNGMYIDNELFYYSHLSKMVLTSNYCKRIEICLQFAASEELIINIPLDDATLKMLECLEIQLDNMHVLEYIISNKRKAFEQIYNKGYVVVPIE